MKSLFKITLIIAVAFIIAVVTLFVIAQFNSKTNQQEKIDTLIENKIDSTGVLSLTEYEFSEDSGLMAIERAIERRINFTLINLSDQDSTISKLEEIFKNNKENYRVVEQKKPGVMDILINTLDGVTLGATAGAVTGSVVPLAGNIAGGVVGGVVGGTGALAYSLKDYVKELFAEKVDWLILKSADKSILKVDFVKDLQ